MNINDPDFMDYSRKLIAASVAAGKALAEGYESEWEYIKDLDCWRNKKTGKVMPYEPAEAENEND